MKQSKIIKEVNIPKRLIQGILKNKQILLFATISIIFTFLYGSFIFTSNNIMLGNSPVNDAYQTFEGVAQDLVIVHSGHLPTGVYWLPNFYGGSIATWFYVSCFPDIGFSLYTLISGVTNNLVLSLKIIEFITLFIAQFCSYELSKYFFKKTWIAWIISLAYTFSSYYFIHVNDGHLNFVMAAALLPAVFLLFEKMLASPTRRNTFFASTGLIILFLTDIQTMIFSLFFFLFRICYYFVINYRKNVNMAILKRLLELTAIVALFAAPFLFSFTILQNTQALIVTQANVNSIWIPQLSQLFVKPHFPPNPAITEVAEFEFYLGVSLLAISLIPIFVSRTQSKFDRKSYIFFGLAFAFFVLVSIGTPFMNLVTVFFIRAIDRAMSIVILSLCMCAGYGLLCLGDFFNQRSIRFHWMKSKSFKTVLIICLATIVFSDLTIGLSPQTSPVMQLTDGDQFIKNQSGDFRVLAYPVIYCSTNYESTLIGHEILGESVMSLRSAPQNSALFTQLNNYFSAISSPYSFNKTSAAWSINASQLALLSTLCGAKYILVENNQTNTFKYNSFFGNATKYFTKVFNSTESAVYENLYFEGIVFAVKDNGELPVIGNYTVDDLSRVSLPDVLGNLTIEDFSNASIPNGKISCTQSFNKIELTGNLPEPAYVIISQSYYPYWAVNNGERTEFTNFLNVTALKVDKGTFNATATFAVGDQTQNLYLAFYLPLLLVCALFIADWKAKKRLFQLASSLLTVSGLALVSLVFLQTNSAPSLNWTDFGPFGKLVTEFGVLIAAGGVLGLGKDKVLAFTRRFPINNPKLLVSNIKTPLKIWVNSSDSISKLIKFLIVSLLIFIGIINLPLLQSETASWTEPTFAGGILSLIVLLYAMKISLSDKKTASAPSTDAKLSNSEDSKQNGIQGLHLGIFGGLIGVSVGGLLMRILTSYTNDYVSLGLFLAITLGGFGFAALTSGNHRLRGIIACLFGVIAIVFGLIMTYTTPIIIGYMQPTGTSTLYPLYKWHEYTFIRFFEMQLFTSDSIAFSFVGLAVSYLGAPHIAFSSKSKKNLKKTLLPPD